MDYLCWEDFCPTVINGGERLMKDGIHIEGDASRFLFPAIDPYIEKMGLLGGAKWQP